MKELNSPSIIPLDMDQLQAVTKETFSFQKEVLDLFFLNVSECLNVIEKSTNNDTWLYAIEEIKSLSNCIGAKQISRTCSLAQSITLNSEENRQKVYTKINDNIQILKVFIRNTRY